MSMVSEKWLSLFNNIEDDEQLDEFLKATSGDSLQDWEVKFLQYEQWGKDYIERELGTILYDEYNPQEKLRVSIHWLDLFKPICFKYLERLTSFLNKTQCITNTNEFILEIESVFFEICMNMSYRTVVLEINDLRRASRLKGEDSKNRYNYFINTLLKDRDYILEFYKKYPVLFELLDKKISNVLDYIEQIILHFEENLIDLESYFNYKNLKLSSIDFNAGDTHSNGKSVCILKLNTKKKLVYKPRNMFIDVNLNLFSKEFAHRFGLSELLFVPKTLSKDSYSFVEFIEEKECNSLQEVEVYYTNMGKLLAFLHIFGAKDYHGENILACQEHPYLIDNETILHFSEPVNITSNAQNIYNFVTNSVYSVGILPMNLYSANNDKGMEIGALNSGERRESPYLSHQLANVGTDEIRIEKVFKIVGDFPSTVRYKGKNVSCSSYLNEVQRGFETIYKIVLQNRNIVSRMIIKYFENCETRYIYRNTNIYVQFLETSHHPELLKNKYDFEMYLLRLFEYGDVANLFDNVMMKDEVCQLRKGDIPIFYANTSSNEIYNGLGRYICALDGHSIANKVLNRITSLSDDNLLRQKRIINMAFMGSELFSKKFRVSEEHMNTETITSKIINRISSAKFEFNNETSWLAMVAMNKSYEIYPMDCSLYSGTSGMILGITSIDDTRLRTLLPGVINYTNNYIKELQGNFPVHQLGAFTGVYGYLYTLCVLREEGTPFVEDIEEITYETLSSTFRQLRNIDNLDIIGGLAGILGVLIKIQKTMLDSSRVTELTQKLSEGVVQKILEKYKKDGFWIENDPGYAHGNYGIITQLYRYSLSNTCKFDAKTSIISCIKEYLDKERSLLCGKNGFPLRNNAKYYSWCNGIVGIVNAKNYLETNEFPDKFLKTEVQDYSIKILNQDSTLDNSICHGSIGNLVILDSILGYSVDIENRIATESSSYLLDKETYECDDWGILTGEMGILMANDRKSRTRLNDILLLN